MMGPILDMVTRQGGEFWKFHYRQVGAPTRTHVQLLIDEDDPSKDCIVWKDVGDKNWVASVTLVEIVDIRKGPTSKTFEDNVLGITNPLLCFSIYTRGRTLDIEAVHPEDFRVWMATLAYLLGGDASFSNVDAPEGSIFHAERQKTPLTGLMDDLGRHLRHTNAPLDSIAAWVQEKRLTAPAGNALVPYPGAPPALAQAANNVDPIDVNQMLLAGGYRLEAPASAVAYNGAKPATIPMPMPSQKASSSIISSPMRAPGAAAASQSRTPSAHNSVHSGAGAHPDAAARHTHPQQRGGVPAPNGMPQPW